MVRIAAVPDNAPENEPALGYFEDDPIWGAKLRVKGLGDGLSKLAEVEPVELGRGQRVALVIEAFVDSIAFVPGKSQWEQDGVDRLHVLRAGLVTIVDPAVVKKALDAHQKRLDEAANRRSLFAEQEAAKAEAAEADNPE